MPTGTKFLKYTRANVLGDTNQTYYTGTDSDVDNQKTNISANGQLLDGTPVSFAKEFYPIYLDANNVPYGGVATGWQYGGTPQSSDFLNQRLWDPGQCAINGLRIVSAVKNLETVTIDADIYEINTQSGRSVSPHIPVDCTGGATVRAHQALTFTTNVADGDTVTIDTKVYTFLDVLLNANGNVKIGADAATSIQNLVDAINLTGTPGTQYALAMTKHTTCTAVKTSATVLTATANAGGTAGNSIATTETSSHIAWGNTTLLLGVDPTAANGVDQLLATINTSNTQGLIATKIATNELLISTSTPQAAVLACTETLAGANNGFNAAAMYGGRAAGLRRSSTQARVPLAQEVTLGLMHFMFDFPPSFVNIMIIVTATPGVALAWDGAVTIVGNRVTLDNTGSVDWAATNKVFITVSE